MCIATGVANGNGVSSLLLILGMNLLYYVPLIVLIVLGIRALMKYLRAGKRTLPCAALWAKRSKRAA